MPSCPGRRLDSHRSITATDVFSAYTWAELRVTNKNPSARWTSALARRVAEDLHLRGVKLERVMTDNASEFRAHTFEDTLIRLGVRHTFIHAGRPQTNGAVERVQGTILQECYERQSKGDPPRAETMT